MIMANKFSEVYYLTAEVSSDTESEYADEYNVFYDEESNCSAETKYSLSQFDRDRCGLSSVYLTKFLPKLKDRSNNFMQWLIKMNLLPSTVLCPNATCDSNCSAAMQFTLAVGLNDMYQLKCRNCGHKESVRKNSFFYGLKCNIRSVIRMLYGWVKGVHIETMADILGLPTSLVGKVYNRAAKISLCCTNLCMSFRPGILEFGGENGLVMVDVYPHLLETIGKTLKKNCKPILCFSEIDTIPQRYWLEVLDPWNPDDPEEVEKTTKNALNVILNLVKPGTILLLPSQATLSFSESMDTLNQFFPSVKSIDELLELSTPERPFPFMLDIIWKTPIQICEQAQYFNPHYVSQFIVKNMWNILTDRDGFVMLISSIVYETRRNNIEKYF